MSYRSVGIPTSKIYTIDSTGVVKTELLQDAGHKGSYFLLVSHHSAKLTQNDLVNEVFPAVGSSHKPEFTDFKAGHVTSNLLRSDFFKIITFIN